MVWLPGKSKFSYVRARGAVSVLNNPIGGIQDINPSPNEISDDDVNGAFVGITARATDPTPGDTVSYSLTDDANGRFAIDSSTGVVTLADDTQIDSTVNSSHNITVLATSSDTSTSQTTFTIAVTGEPPPLSSANWFGYGGDPSAYSISDMENDLGRVLPVREYFSRRTTFSDDIVLANQQLPNIPSSRQIAWSWDLPRQENGLNAPIDITSGNFDSQMETLAQIFIDNGHGDAVIRFQHEADLDNRPTRSFRNSINGTNAGPNFRTHWIYVHDLMMAVPGANFEWHYGVNGDIGIPGIGGGPNTQNDPVLGSNTPLLEVGYAGDAYVDAVGVGIYDRGTFKLSCASGALAVWQTSNTKKKMDYVSGFAIDRGKRFGSYEHGCQDVATNGCGDDPAFHENVVLYMQALGSNRDLLVYFNHPGNDLNNFPNTKQKIIDLFGV